ncbi:EscU/YscU/HrcU family type III secretion system export apparatus switch protein [Texcoconibacillus texcoconensis]|uniref:Flagellar biosynthesis protein n=1 Tax=Texcoconibacillus texcoconensis TaxID=1095777 RepID=A0A840QL50_9BACI|nr:EscU/YscU/HrcU family type III secretion system export apparatus switch protein [Texcoconibacillus texcoconensis]MBB5172094.1 flagellar biosynthesis protein [Texcoconibacillus texcoconensis]
MSNHYKSIQKSQQRAVALNYDGEKDEAPKVKAKGRGYVADQLVDIAEKNNIPIQEDSSLVELLAQLEVNEQIPTELYEVVAELFAFIYRIDRQMDTKSNANE